MTSAYLELKLALAELGADFEATVVPFDEIIQRVKADEFDAGLIIHEGQLTYEKEACTPAWSWASGGTS